MKNRYLMPMILIGLSSLGFAAPAFALTSLREAQMLVRQAQANCPELNCPDTRAQVKALSRNETQKLPRQTLDFLRAAAQTYAENIWPDTILETAYEVQLQIRLDRLELLILDGETVGYRIEFSTEAWDRDQCPAFTEKEISENNVDDLIKEKCLKGRIIDRAFALPNPLGTFDDETFDSHFNL